MSVCPRFRKRWTEEIKYKNEREKRGKGGMSKSIIIFLHSLRMIVKKIVEKI